MTRVPLWWGMLVLGEAVPMWDADGGIGLDKKIVQVFP